MEAAAAAAPKAAADAGLGTMEAAYILYTNGDG